MTNTWREFSLSFANADGRTVSSRKAAMKLNDFIESNIAAF